MTAQARPASRVIEATVEVSAPLDAVWKALMDPEESTRWFPLEAGTNPDGTVWMGWRDQFRFSGRVEAIEPMKYMRSVPVFPPGVEPPVKMATEIWLESRGGKTVVRLVQSGFLADAGWDEEFDGTSRGWQFMFRSLRLYLEQHRGTPRHVAWARRLIGVDRAEAWRRVMSPAGILREGSLDGLRMGGPFRFVTADGDALEGTVETVNGPKDFAGIVSNWNDAHLRVQFDDLPMRGYRDAALWLSTWGVPSEKVTALEQRWVALLAKLLPEPPARKG